MSLKLNIATMTACQVVVTLTTAVTMIVITRHYGPEQYGAFTVAWGIVGMLSLLAVMGIQFILVRELAVSFDDGPKMLAAAIVAMLANTVLASLLLLLLSLFLRLDLALSFWLLGTSGLLSGQAALWSVYRSKEQFRQEALTESLKALAYLIAVLALVLVLHSRHIADAVTAQFVINAAVLVLIFRLVSKAYGERYALSRLLRSADLSRIIYVYRTGLSMMCISAGSVVYSKITVIMVGHYLGLHAAGVFGAGYRLFETATGVTSVLLGVIYPKLVKLSSQPGLFRNRMNKILAAVVLGWACCGVLAYVLSPLVAVRLLGEEYRGTVPVLQLLGWAIGVNAIASLYGIVMRVFRMEVWLAVVTASGAVVNVGLNLVLTPRYGTRGACFAVMLSLTYVAAACMLAHARRRHCPPAAPVSSNEACPAVIGEAP